ncbi:hypothetical protein GIB67_019679 [Kingdonia uniflora]|uniref:DUF6821 domain-containing protein n=1 Tax=Kingdonia uniflora TaxID=39325 RepID=A0A7J7MJT6_9MAGN|nr:hypothetical protein GIB67_019679 [Kingdonia uniflora]
MEKVMDLDDWEFIPSDGFFLDDFGTSRRKKGGLFAKQTGFDRKGDIDMNEFISPSPRPLENAKFSSLEGTHTKQHVPTLIPLEPRVLVTLEHDLPKLPPISPKKTCDQDTISQVYYKKIKEPEFADMKMKSPKSETMNFKSQFEPEPLRFEQKQEVIMVPHEAKTEKSEIVATKNNMTSCGGGGGGDDHDGGINLWGWRLGGIGTLCYIGVAAATICIFIVGNKGKNKGHHHHQKIQYQIYSDDKKVIKQVVQHHQQNRLNQAISAVGGGLALSGAHITWGGHYNGL